MGYANRMVGVMAGFERSRAARRATTADRWIPARRRAPHVSGIETEHRDHGTYQTTRYRLRPESSRLSIIGAA
ncbi:MAG: hypothetical protein DLM60_11840 [Pseudonocardiales bacterium]|nr:MAG: hypothetical protein DLM60_11840 [Pseudonocardiales bacterium]